MNSVELVDDLSYVFDELYVATVSDDAGARAAARLARDMISDMIDDIEASGWRGIDSAPKDGTRVLTFRAGFAENVAVAWYNDVEKCWVPVNGSSWPEPTHWMPIPGPLPIP